MSAQSSSGPGTRASNAKHKRTAPPKRSAPTERGRLRIGDDWNAITIIALSQSNPLKAIAEFVENSIDARAQHDHDHARPRARQHYLAIRDDGEGVPRDADGEPGLPLRRHAYLRLDQAAAESARRERAARRVRHRAAELLDRRRRADHDLDRRGPARLSDGHAQGRSRLHGDAATRAVRRAAGPKCGSRRCSRASATLSGEKIQWYLASELRDRIRRAGVRITVDRQARAQAIRGRAAPVRRPAAAPAARGPHALGDAYAELYLNEPAEANRVALYRHGTRVIEDLAQLDDLARPPWTSRYLQGHHRCAVSQSDAGHAQRPHPR